MTAAIDAGNNRITFTVTVDRDPSWATDSCAAAHLAGVIAGEVMNPRSVDQDTIAGVIVTTWDPNQERVVEVARPRWWRADLHHVTREWERQAR